jgi:hypothetical protein
MLLNNKVIDHSQLMIVKQRMIRDDFTFQETKTKERQDIVILKCVDPKIVPPNAVAWCVWSLMLALRN